MKAERVFPPQPGPPGVVLSLSDPEKLQWEAQQVQLAITRRAYELFEARGREHGHDWEDWFQAESELLRPVPVTLSESREWISVRASVLGFDENELRVSVEPRRIVIMGKKQVSAAQSEGGKTVYIDWYPDQILQVIELPTHVVPEGASIELHMGLLKFELPKTLNATVAAAAA